MLRFGDSANFSRTLAAIGLLAGPLLLAISGLIDPAWDDNAATYLGEVAANEGAYIAAGAISTVGTLLFIVGMLGVLRLMRRRAVSLGQVAAGLLVFGLIGLTPTLAFYGIDVNLARADNREAAAAIYDQMESGPLVVYWVSFFFIGILLGSLLLAIALFRRRIVPIWSPILLIVAMVVGFFGQSSVVSALSFVLLGVALAPLAMRIWRLTDDEWKQWELPVDREATPGPRTETSPTV